MNVQEIREKYATDEAGAGAVNPSYKAKTAVMERLGRSQGTGKETSKGFRGMTGSPSKDYQMAIADAKKTLNEAIAFARKNYDEAVKRAKEELERAQEKAKSGDRTLRWAGTNNLSPGYDTTLYWKNRPHGPEPKYGFVMGKNARLESKTSRSNSKNKLPVYHGRNG